MLLDGSANNGDMGDSARQSGGLSMDAGIDPPMIVRGPDEGAFVRANASFYARTGLTAAELAEQPFLAWIDPGDRKRVEALLDGGQPDSCRAGHATRSGDPLPLEIEVRSTPDGTTVLGRCAADDVLEAPHGDGIDEGTVTGTLLTIARIVEDQIPGHKCSILLVDQD